MRDHKSLLAWQAARAVTGLVLKLSLHYWHPNLRAVFDQLQRSSLSVQINIAEGYGFGESPSFRKHLRIAYASAIETMDLLEVLAESTMVDQSLTAAAIADCRRSQQLIHGLMKRYGGLSTTSKT